MFRSILLHSKETLWCALEAIRDGITNPHLLDNKIDSNFIANFIYREHDSLTASNIRSIIECPDVIYASAARHLLSGLGFNLCIDINTRFCLDDGEMFYFLGFPKLGTTFLVRTTDIDRAFELVAERFNVPVYCGGFEIYSVFTLENCGNETFI